MKVILTHEHADFDAVASLVGMARLVPDAVPVLPQSVNDNVADYLTVFGGELPLIHRDELPRAVVEHAYVVDTRRAQAVRGMTRNTPISVIDHHVDDDLGQDDVLELDVQPVGATATLLAERLAGGQSSLSGVEATLLLLGIYEDTGSFTFSATTSRDLRAAAWLLANGADLQMRERFLRYGLSPEAQELYRTLIDTLEIKSIGGHSIVFASARSPGFDEELATIATKMIDYLDPSALLLLVDVGAHVQLVARSLVDGVDVGMVAEAVGGGGHARASAAVLRDVDLKSASALVAEALPQSVRARALVADVMSRGVVQTLLPEQTVDEAIEFARRCGHEGYPVVAPAEGVDQASGDDSAGELANELANESGGDIYGEPGVVLGVVSRRELDRALHHHMGHRPVGSLLSGDVPTVSPNDSTAELLATMLRHDVGQVPVIDNGRLVGIATRTDLLRQWSGTVYSGRSVSHMSVGAQLADALGPENAAATRQIADIAESRGERAYLVGGLPRDIVMGIDSGVDVDVVVDGDAVAVARAASEKHGGRVTAHNRFGTAKWAFDDVAIDLISARTEYYREPTALPSVSRGSLRSDLRRRDFTINTLAVDLSHESYGHVVDLFGGLRDIDGRVIRVLHSLSFVEDPTRIIRAVRFETRLGFRMENRTEELVSEAVELMHRVSGARIRNELLQLFAEPDPATALARLDELGVLPEIGEGLHPGNDIGRHLDELQRAWSEWPGQPGADGLPESPSPVHRLIMWLASLGKAGERSTARLRLSRRDEDLVRAVVTLLAEPGPLAADGPRGSAVYHALRSVPTPALVLTWLLTDDSNVRGNLMWFASELSAVRIEVSGDDLADLGVPKGPVYGQVLRSVLDARLDGNVSSRDAEMSLLRRLVAAVERS